MRNIINFIICFTCIFSFAQKKDSIFVLYSGDNEIIKISTSKSSEISGFTILRDGYKTKKQREERLKYLREHGGGDTGFYIGFTGVKNFVVTGNLNGYELNTIEDISKQKVIMGYGQKVFFIEKLDCNKYKFHETHLGYN